MVGGMNRLGCGVVAGAVLVLACGCPPGNPGPTNRPGATPAVGGEEPPPHGGTLFAEPGHKHHAELKIDKDAKTATVYLFDAKVKNGSPTSAPAITLTIKNGGAVQVPLKAERQDGDPAGKSSRFVGTHDKLAGDLDMDKVEISAEVDGKPYVFTLDKD
jgi:hypothetical protein